MCLDCILTIFDARHLIQAALYDHRGYSDTGRRIERREKGSRGKREGSKETVTLIR